MFFTQMNHMMNQSVDITLVIRKKEGQLTVSAMPKSNGLKDEAQNHIVPFIVTGTPEELDMGFIQAICQPMQKATGLLTNMSSFEQQADKAAANSKAAKELKDKEAKEAKEKKEKFDKHMKNVADFEAEKKYSEVLAALQQARAFATPQALKQVDEKITALKIKQGQGSLFDMEPIVQPQQPAQINTGQQNIQQQFVSGQPTQQPVNGSVIPNGQPFNGQQQPVYGNGQPMYQQPVYQQPQGGQQYYNNQPYSGQVIADVLPDPEPRPIAINDPSAHREGEYDQYPDFPGYTDNRMNNYQNA